MPCRLRCLYILDTGGHQEQLSSSRANRGSYPARRELGGRTKGKPETGVVFSSLQNSDASSEASLCDEHRSRDYQSRANRAIFCGFREHRPASFGPSVEDKYLTFTQTRVVTLVATLMVLDILISVMGD